jgi:hypothetical protein
MLEMGFHILLVVYHLPILVVWEAPLAPGWEAVEVMEDCQVPRLLTLF